MWLLSMVSGAALDLVDRRAGTAAHRARQAGGEAAAEHVGTGDQTQPFRKASRQAWAVLGTSGFFFQADQVVSSPERRRGGGGDDVTGWAPWHSDFEIKVGVQGMLWGVTAVEGEKGGWIVWRDEFSCR